MVLFDLKDGYCQRDFRLAKRFCCGSIDTLSAFHSHGPLQSSQSRRRSSSTVCVDWRTWDEVFQNRMGFGPRVDAVVKFLAFAFIAVSMSNGLCNLARSSLRLVSTSTSSYSRRLRRS